ncbi:DinB family protein [Paenibacillus flagellatus]|uniref:DinB family protein n=1 Tax=Paenibacillus flagellatus TaxID=2211139 RepID=A0A2V5K074_9BACL|nr:DinB family protein [Paenibacillus flagellatus]PYI52528.1 DinB family protein [Paenibacillus flagellatus]
MQWRKPEMDEFHSYYEGYIGLVPEGDLRVLLENRLTEAERLYGAIREQDGLYAYAPGKWTVKQLLGHLTDTERVMGYRLLCALRGDTVTLPGFDQDDYVRSAESDRQPLDRLLSGFLAVRRTTLALVEEAPGPAWDNRIEVNGNPITARALAYIIAGHEIHHSRVLQERYGEVLGRG